MRLITEEKLTLASLGEMDGGKIGRVVERLLRRMADDCNDRPADERERELTIKIGMVPICSGEGVAEAVKTQVKASAKVPHHQSRPYEMRITNSGSGLAFNAGAPDSVAQHTMNFDDSGDE